MEKHLRKTKKESKKDGGSTLDQKKRRDKIFIISFQDKDEYDINRIGH